MTRSKRETMVEDKGRINDDKELVVKEEKEKEEDQMKEKKIKIWRYISYKSIQFSSSFLQNKFKT